MREGSPPTVTVFRSKVATAIGMVGLPIANGITTGAIIHSPGAQAMQVMVLVAVLTAVLWQLTWRCAVTVTQNDLRVYYLSCYREVPLPHVSGVTIERGDLVVTTGSGQRIKPWAYLASVAGAAVGYPQKKAVRDALTARVEHAEPAECLERHGLTWEFDVKAVAVIVAYYAAVTLIAASR